MKIGGAIDGEPLDGSLMARATARTGSRSGRSSAPNFGGPRQGVEATQVVRSRCVGRAVKAADHRHPERLAVALASADGASAPVAVLGREQAHDAHPVGAQRARTGGRRGRPDGCGVATPRLTASRGQHAANAAVSRRRTLAKLARPRSRATGRGGAAVF